MFNLGEDDMVHPHVFGYLTKLGNVRPSSGAQRPRSGNFCGSFVRANLNSGHSPSRISRIGDKLPSGLYPLHRFFKSIGANHQGDSSNNAPHNFLQEVFSDKCINSDIKNSLALGAKSLAALAWESDDSGLSKNMRGALQSAVNLENKLHANYVALKEKIRSKDEFENQRFEKKIDKVQDKLEHKNALDKESTRQLKGEKIRLQRHIGAESRVPIQLTSSAQKSIRRRIEKIEKKLGKLDQAIKKRDAIIAQARAGLTKKKESDAQRAVYLSVEEVSLQAYRDLSRLSRIIDRLIKEKMASDQRSNIVDDSLHKLEKINHDLRDVADLYGGVAALAGQEQQILFDQLHKLAIFKDSPAIGTAATTEQGATLSIGGGWGDGINNVALVGTLEFKKSKTIVVDKPDDLNSFVQKKATISLNLGANTGGGVLSLNAGAAGSVEVMKDYFENSVHNSDSLISISKNDLVRDNDRRSRFFILGARSSHRVLMNKKFRTMTSAVTNFRNFFLRARDEAKNPYLPRYINTRFIENAARANTTLVERFQQSRGNIAELSLDNMVSVSQSLPGSRSLADKMIPLSPVAIKPDFAQAGTVVGTLSAGAKLGLWSSKVETDIGNLEFKAGIKSSAEARVKYSWFNGRKNKFSREIADLDNTGSIALSNQLIKDCVASFHGKLSAGEKLPEYMRGIVDLYQQSIKVEQPIALNQHLLSAIAQLKTFDAQFAQWRKDALQLQRLAGKYKENSELPLHDKQAFERIRACQCLVDKLSIKKLSKKGGEKIALAAVIKMYDEWSVTAAILERAACLDKVLEALKKEDDADLRATAQDFIELYQKLTARLDNPQLGLSKKHLLTDNLLQAHCTLKKYGASCQGNIDRALALPAINNYLEGAKLAAGIGVTVTGAYVKNHPNVARSDRYKTISYTGQLNLWGLQQLVEAWMLRKVLSEVNAVAVAQIIGDIVGLTEGDATLTVTIAYKGDALESIQLSQTQKRALNMPIIPMAKFAASPVKLGFKVTDRVIRSEVIHTLLGDDLAIHMLQAGRLDAALKFNNAKVAGLEANPISENRWQVEKIDLSTRRAFFGLNSVADILEKFSQENFDEKATHAPGLSPQTIAGQQVTEETLGGRLPDNFSFTGLGIFKSSFVAAYLDKTKAEACSPKNAAKVLAALPQKEVLQAGAHSDATAGFKELRKYFAKDIFLDGNPHGQGLQAMQVYVKELLDSRIEAGGGNHDISARAYLASASEKERVDFYAGNKVGQQLFSAYRLIIKQANEMKVRLNAWQPLVVKH